MKTVVLFIIGFVIFLFVKGANGPYYCELICEDQGMLVFEIHNESLDTAYVFDGYLQMCTEGFLYSSKYVHRYEKKTNTYKLSLLPILTLIAPKGCMNDKILWGEKKITSVGQIPFSFIRIPPGNSIKIRILKSAFYNSIYIKSTSLDGLPYGYGGGYKAKEKKKCRPTSVVLEFAVYRQVDKLLKWCNDISVEEYSNQGKTYSCVSTVVEL